MGFFHIKASRPGGEIYESNLEADDKSAIFEELKQKGESVISIEENDSKRSLDWRKILLAIQPIKTHDKIILTRNLGAMLEAGLPLSRALQVMGRQTRNPNLKNILFALGESIKKGVPLSESLKSYPKVFSPLVVSMVRVGEESGNLSGSLISISRQMEAVYTLERRVKGALIYPAVVLTAMLMIALLMSIYIIPSLTATLKDLNVALPLTTRIIIFGSDFLATHTFLSFLILCLIVVGFYFLFKQPIVRKLIGNTFLRLPVIGSLIRETNSARTARTLGSLIGSGVNVILALEITGEVIRGGRFREVLATAKENIKNGKPIAAVFGENDNLYPPFMGEMISIGEETGRLSEMLTGVAVFYEAEVEQKTKDLGTIIEPVLMIVIGLAVGVFAVSMISPMYSLVGSIQ